MAVSNGSPHRASHRRTAGRATGVGASDATTGGRRRRRHRPLWLAGIRRRPAAAAALFLVAMLTTALAASGPMLIRAVEQSSLRSALLDAQPGDDDITVSVESAGPGDPSQAVSAPSVADAIDLVPALGRAAGTSLFGPPLVVAESQPIDWRLTAAGRPTGAVQTARLAARSDGCAAFALLAGRCPRTAAEVLIPQSDRRLLDIGATLSTGLTRLAPYTVVGVYDPGARDALLPSAGGAVTPNAVTTGPDLVVTTSGLAVRERDCIVAARVQPRVERIGLDSRPQALAALDAVRRVSRNQTRTVAIESGLPDLLAASVNQDDAAGVLVLAATVQALVLGWFSAVVVMNAVARVRAREWALTRLRGVRRTGWLSAVFTEPVMLVVSGGVVGWLAGTGFSRVAATHWTAAHSNVEPTRVPVLLAAAAAVAGLVVALVVASRRSARAPLATLLREGAEPARVSRTVAVAEVLVAALTALALYQLHESPDLLSTNSHLALLVPALLAMTLSLLAIRAVVRWVRRRSERPARHVSTVLMLRRVARTPFGLHRGVPVALALALAVFVTQQAVESTRNRQLLADATIGADEVWRVQVPAGVDLLTAVRRADPGGTEAMAVQERDSSGDRGVSRVVAVDSSRMARVSPWRTQWAGTTGPALATVLHPAAPAPITVVGSRLSVTVRGLLVTPTEGRLTPPPLHLLVTLFDGTRWFSPEIGVLSDKRPTSTAPVTCPRGCRLVSMQLAAIDENDPYFAEFTISSLATDRQPASVFANSLHQSGRWRSAPTTIVPGNGTSVGVSESEAGLFVTAHDAVGTQRPTFAPADLPDPIPALFAASTTTKSAPGHPDQLEGTGLDGQRQLLRYVGRAAALPRSLDDGVLVDLDLAEKSSDPTQAQVTNEVWLTPGAHDDIAAALARSRITVLTRTSLADERSALSRTATAQAAQIGAALVIPASLLAALVLAAVQSIDVEQRRRLWVVARVSGLSGRRTAALVLLEVALPAVFGALVGVLAGLAAVLLAGTRIPLFPVGTIHPPIDSSPSSTALAVVAGAALGAVALIALALSATERYFERVHR